MSRVDIGLCVSGNDDTKPVPCLDGDERNYCCNQDGIVGSVSGQANVCCTYEEYADQHWVSLAVIQGYAMFLVFFFMCTLGWLGWFYVSSFMIKEKDVKDSRRRIVKSLLKSQILHKSGITAPTAVGSMNRVRDKFSSSSSSDKKRKAAEKKKNKRKSDDKPLAASGVSVPSAAKGSGVDQGIMKNLYKNMGKDRDKSPKIRWSDLRKN